MTERYFADRELPVVGDTLLLSAEESHHLMKVMRLRPGAEVKVFGGGQEASATFQGAEGKQALLIVRDFIKTPSPPAISLQCLVPWIKGGRTELVLQKLTELGTASLTVYHARREVMRGSGEKLERLRRVVLDACKQCGRADVPTLSEARDLLAAVGGCQLPPDRAFILNENEEHLLLGRALLSLHESGPPGKGIVLASGPEGGFDPAELEAVKELMTSVTLGPRILRAETAPIAAVAAALAIWGEL